MTRPLGLAPLGFALVMAASFTPASAGEGSDVAVDASLRWLDRVADGVDPEAPGVARVALKMAGPAAIPALVAQLDGATGPRRAAAAWALGLVAAPIVGGPPADERAIAALRRALGAADWETRLFAASSLGALDAAAASGQLADALLDPERPPAAEPVLLLALAGTAGPEAFLVDEFLARGGDAGWAEAATAIALRRGRASWPAALAVLRNSPDETARAEAAAVLLLLADPDSACDLMETFGTEPHPVIRRLILQAIAATQQPAVVAFLEWASERETDASLREAAGILAHAAAAKETSRPGEAKRPLAALLAELAAKPSLPGDLDDVRALAGPGDVPLLDEALRRLPLRGDDGWMLDYGELAQVRARACASDHGGP